MNIFEEAAAFALERHSGQTRKLTATPYILHPFEVASIVATLTDDLQTIAAAVLHDTVEDTNTTIEEIEQNFGRQVALLVMTETEDKRENLPEAETWKLRKIETLLILKNTKDIRVKMLWLGDKLSNMRSFYREKCIKNVDVFSFLNQKDPSQQAWYYRTIAKNLLELKDTPAYREYIDLTEKVFEGIQSDEDTDD